MPPIPITDWTTLIEQIRRRPGMFLGRVTLKGLSHFLDGIQFAERTYQIPPDRCVVDSALVEFEEWVAERFNPEHLAVRSFYLASHAAGSDEAAFRLWLDWYDEYCRGR